MNNIELNKLEQLGRGEINSFPIHIQSIQDLVTQLENFDYIFDNYPSFDNWECDFKYNFYNEINNITISLTGSLWYGEYRITNITTSYEDTRG